MSDNNFLKSDEATLRVDADTSEKYTNRGHDTIAEEPTNVKIGLVDIDTAIISYINDVIKPEVTHDNTKFNVPVLYANPERWKSVRRDGVLHDNRNKLQIPLILIRRTAIRKNSLNSPINVYLEKEMASVGWNPRNKYDRFAVQNNIKKSQRYISLLYPDYYDLEYECIIWTEFNAQMNSIIEQISFEVENYWGEKDKYKFKTSVGEYTNNIDLPETTDRIVRSTFLMTVKAYLLPEKYIDRYGNPTTVQKTKFTTKKIIMTEKIIP